MIFDENLFKKVIRGEYAAFADENGVLHTKRFTDKQAAVIAERCPTAVYQQAGMRLDFYTDADALAMDFHYVHLTSRIFLSVDVYEDEVLTYSFVEKNAFDIKKGGFRHEFEKKGKKRVTVFLPYSVELCFDKIELEGESFVEPYDNYSAFAYIIGDSITHGYDAEITSQSYANVAVRRLDLDCINQGVGGYVFNACALDPELLAGKKKPDIITVAYGTNDWSGKTKEDFCRDCEEYLCRMHELFPTTPVLIITPVWRAAHYVVTKAGSFAFAREFIAESAKKYENMYVLDGDKLVPHSYDYFRDVRLHPNDIGFATYGTGVADAIAKILGICPKVHFI